MKKTLICTLLVCFYITGNSQHFQPEKYALTTSATSVGFGAVKILDPYLSPFAYSGAQLRIQSNTRRFFSPENIHWSYSNHGLLDLGLTKHPNRNNSMLFFNLNYMFGVNYHFRPAKNLMILAGGGWDVDLGGKYMGRNVNNPFSLDLYTNLNATAEVQYKFNIGKQDFSVKYGLQTPLAGCMFVPMQGITYYELFSLSNSDGAFHFSSLHNRRALAQRLHLDVPLTYCTLRFGIQHEFLTYSANDMVFHKDGIIFSVGSVYDIYIFSGKKKKVPSNFISPNE